LKKIIPLLLLKAFLKKSHGKNHRIRREISSEIGFLRWLLFEEKMTNRLKDPIVCLYSVLHLIKPLLESEYPEMAIRSLESPLSAEILLAATLRY
jgi:hypothetical protein